MAPTPKRRARRSRSDDFVELNGVLVEQEPAKKPSPPQREEEVEGRDALLLLSRSPRPKRTKPSAEPTSAPRPKGDDGPAGEATKPSRRTWSAADEVRILEALAALHSPPDDADKAFYDSLLGLLDDKSCYRRELKDTVRSLQRRYENDTSKGLSLVETMSAASTTSPRLSGSICQQMLLLLPTKLRMATMCRPRAASRRCPMRGRSWRRSTSAIRALLRR